MTRSRARLVRHGQVDNHRSWASTIISCGLQAYFCEGGRSIAVGVLSVVLCVDCLALSGREVAFSDNLTSGLVLAVKLTKS